MNNKSVIVLAAMSVLFATTARKASAQDKKADAAQPTVEAAKGPETLTFDKTNKMPPVVFPHAAHGKKFDCKECHGGDNPLFPQKKQEAGMKMADFYAGKECGACHDGKKKVGDTVVFAAKSSCMKCHKKPAP